MKRNPPMRRNMEWTRRPVNGPSKNWRIGTVVDIETNDGDKWMSMIT
jgi:hypothetical protein